MSRALYVTIKYSSIEEIYYVLTYDNKSYWNIVYDSKIREQAERIQKAFADEGLEIIKND